MPEVDVFLIGVPKAGTTWLAYVLDQHHSITLSNPKEPNIIASHRGTFVRNKEEPDWGRFETLKPQGSSEERPADRATRAPLK